MNQPCPICGRPIEDTAYVCNRCVTHLADDLRRMAADWHEIEATIARQTVTVSLPGRPRPSAHGEICEAWPDCDHVECAASLQAYVRARQESPPPNEDPAPVNLPASEDAWVIRNTVTTWARHIEEMRGVRIPSHRPRVLAPVVVADPHDTDRPTRCHYSDLPVSQCACGRNHGIEGAS